MKPGFKLNSKIFFLLIKNWFIFCFCLVLLFHKIYLLGFSHSLKKNISYFSSYALFFVINYFPQLLLVVVQFPVISNQLNFNKYNYIFGNLQFTISLCFENVRKLSFINNFFSKTLIFLICCFLFFFEQPNYRIKSRPQAQEVIE